MRPGPFCPGIRFLIYFLGRTRPQSFGFVVLLVGLSGADYKKYRAILQAKRKITDNLKSMMEETVDREVGEWGEAEVKQFRQIQKRLTDEEMEKVVQGYMSGRTVHQLTEEFGCHRQTISSILKQHGVKTDNRIAQKKLNADEIIAMYADMYSSTEIGEKFGVHPQAVLRCLRNHGVKIRSRGNRAHSERE